MTTATECLAMLEALVQGGDPNALTLAENEVEEFLLASPTSQRESARLLGDVQAQLGRRTKPSPLRADMLDLLGTHILRLLEDQSRTDN